MKQLTHKESIRAIKSLGLVLEKTEGQLSDKQRNALVRAVLKTVAPKTNQRGNTNGSK